MLEPLLFFYIYGLEIATEKNKSPTKDSCWAPDDWYYPIEMEYDKRLKAEEEEKEEMERKKLLIEDHAKQATEMPKLNLFDDEDTSLDKEDDLEKEDIESFDYDNAHLGFSEDDFD